MGYYFKSDKVQLYPSALRTLNVNPESRLGTEKNITNAINAITINGSFVVGKNGNNIIFCLHGYYFKVDISGISSPLYVKIKVQNIGSQGYDMPSLISNKGEQEVTILDDDDGFIGMEYSNSAYTNLQSGEYSLQLLDNNGNIPTSSQFKLTADNIAINGTSLTSYLSSGSGIGQANYATVAGKLNNTSAIGSSTLPVYFGTDGVPHEIAKTGVDISIKGSSTSCTGNAATATSATSATTASKLGSSTVGNSTQLVYLNSGSPTAGAQLLSGTSTPTITAVNGSIYVQY